MAKPRKASEIPAESWAFVGLIGAIVAAKVVIAVVDEYRNPAPVFPYGRRPRRRG